MNGTEGHGPQSWRPLHLLLKELRESSHLTQVQLAARCGVDDSTISRVEAGELTASQEVINAYGELANRMRW